MTSSHNLIANLDKADWAVNDPGDAGAISPNSSGICNLITAGAETRTLAIPAQEGITLRMVMVTDGGDCVVTVASAYDEAGGTTLTFSEVGQWCELVSFVVLRASAANTYAWRLTGYDGVTGPTTAAGAITASTVTATGAISGSTIEAGNVILSIADGTNTLALTQATHANRILLVLDATLAITLPEATGTGDTYKVVQGIAATSSTFTTADTTNADYVGAIHGGDTDADAAYTWHSAQGSGNDVITFNGVATGGKIYDWVSFTDVATDVWLVDGMISQSGGSEATPFSST